MLGGKCFQIWPDNGSRESRWGRQAIGGAHGSAIVAKWVPQATQGTENRRWMGARTAGIGPSLLVLWAWSRSVQELAVMLITVRYPLFVRFSLTEYSGILSENLSFFWLWHQTSPFKKARAKQDKFHHFSCIVNALLCPLKSPDSPMSPRTCKGKVQAWLTWGFGKNYCGPYYVIYYMF